MSPHLPPGERRREGTPAPESTPSWNRAALSPFLSGSAQQACISAIGTLRILLTLSGLACGRKGPPRPPEDVLPQTISDLSAANVTDGVQLSWRRPLTYTDGSRMTDLGGFVIERAIGTEPRAAFQRLSVLAVSDRDRFRQVKQFEYVDRDSVPESTYQYRVVSFTLDRYFSEPSNVVIITHKAPREEKHAPLPPPPG